MTTLNKIDAKNFKTALEILPGADIGRLFNQLLDVQREVSSTKRDIARIDAARDLALAEIEKKYDLYRQIFDKIFQQRASVINKHFEIIDKGMTENDRDLILSGLEGLADVVASSPFTNVSELSQLLESNQSIQI